MQKKKRKNIRGNKDKTWSTVLQQNQINFVLHIVIAFYMNIRCQ